MTSPPSRPQSPSPRSSQAGAPKPAVNEPGKPLPGQAQPSAQGQPQQVAQGQKQQVANGEYGEGNYKAAREYDDGVKRHLETHDVEKEARDAAPHSRAEAQDMERAEEAGRAPGRDDVESVKGEKNA